VGLGWRVGGVFTFGKLLFFIISAVNVKCKNMNCSKMLVDNCNF
jgi:hypothetical protein